MDAKGLLWRPEAFQPSGPSGVAGGHRSAWLGLLQPCGAGHLSLRLPFWALGTEVPVAPNASGAVKVPRGGPQAGLWPSLSHSHPCSCRSYAPESRSAGLPWPRWSVSGRAVPQSLGVEPEGPQQPLPCGQEVQDAQHPGGRGGQVSVVTPGGRQGQAIPDLNRFVGRGTLRGHLPGWVSRGLLCLCPTPGRHDAQPTGPSIPPRHHRAEHPCRSHCRIHGPHHLQHRQWQREGSLPHPAQLRYGGCRPGQVECPVGPGEAWAWTPSGCGASGWAMPLWLVLL